MKYSECRRGAIFFLKVGFVVFAIFFCCFMLEPEQATVIDAVYSDNGDVITLNVFPAKLHAYHAPKLSYFGIATVLTLPPVSSIADGCKITHDLIHYNFLFFSLATINAP